jgi:biotin carboxyl carrier protein
MLWIDEMQTSPEISKEPEVNPLKSRRRMSTSHRIAFFLTAWLIVLMPFLFWWNTWFGRSLSDKQLGAYLLDETHPRHIQHALVQIGERMARHDASVAHWYPKVAQLASHRIEEVRNTDAWVMGQDTSIADFHRALLGMLNDSSTLVRGNAALSLVRFGDATGRPQIVALLQPAKVVSPQAGQVVDAAAPGTAIHQGGVILKLQAGQQTIEVRSPISGRVRSLRAPTGHTVASGIEVATVDPGSEQVWEALRGLYLVGQPDDLAAVSPWTRDLPDIPERVRQQALETQRAIQQRNK